MSVTENSIKQAALKASLARDNLTIKYGNRHEAKHYAKVCCICDHFIMHGDEAKMSFDFLKKPVVQMHLKKSEQALIDTYHISADTAKNIVDYYVPQCMPVSRRPKFLTDLYLSPRSYYVDVGHNKKNGFGSCKSCKSSLTAKSQTSGSNIPKMAIANGLMLGEPPEELRCLNDVELAMVSLARIDKHVFAFDGGAHKQLTGWHSMYATDIEAVSQVANWCRDRVVEDEENEDSDGDAHLEELGLLSDSDSSDEEDSDAEDETNEDDDEGEGEEDKPRFAKVFVILSGPFTTAQKAMALKKCEVNAQRLQTALKWLCDNNCLYAEYDINDFDMKEPYRIDDVEIVNSGSSNVERVYEMHAVFPDATMGASTRGGSENRTAFKKNTINEMISKSSDKKATLISRPTKNILRDYQGDNLCKAFPLQFPYGIGSKMKDEDEEHGGTPYLRGLLTMSRFDFHRADFCCILHNMFERQAMVSSSFLKHSNGKAGDYTNISDQDIKEAASRFLNNARGGGIADTFLYRMKAVTASMGHSVGAAKKARQAMYSYITKFGLPAILFTITSEDSLNFRIRVYRYTSEGTTTSFDTGENYPATFCDAGDPNILREFVLDCKAIRRDYPGLCAMDYENVLRITIEHLLGWNKNAKNADKNIADTGLFGDVLAYCVATEEQGRKTLHGHILIWLKAWARLWQELGTCAEGLMDRFKTELELFAKRTMTTEVFGEEDSVCPNPCDTHCARSGNGIEGMVPCTTQEVRNLRVRKEVTSFGGKKILKCGSCETSYTSEDIAIRYLEKKYGGDKLIDQGIMPCCDNGFWERNLHVSNAFVLMEAHAMTKLLPHQCVTDPARAFTLGSETRLMIAVLRNLHRSMHSNKCFKFKGSECRMKIPSAPCGTWKTHLNVEKKDWHTWNGIKKQRRIFQVEPKRGKADVFANIHSAHASGIFGCNTNVVACPDGGSPMYLTAYHSKNTQKEDNSRFGQAAANMIKKMNQKIKDMNEAMEDAEQGEDAPDPQSLGITAMIGAVIQATNAHKCAAPMAAFLTRNGTRFDFSHDTAYLNFNDFLVEGITYNIGTNEDGEPYVKSHVADYIYRPKELQDTCLYDFLSQYSVCQPNARSMEWEGNHPNKKQKVSKLLHSIKVPMMNFFDFEDTKNFEGEDVLSCDIPEEKDTKHHSMESYCKKACVAFVPFRSPSDLKIEGSFQRRFKLHNLNGSLTPEHKQILQNMQDCRNSLRAGRPLDPLERTTESPVEKANKSGRGRSGEEDDALEEAMEMMFNDEASMENLEFPSFRIGDGVYSYETDLVTCLGKHKCGTNLCVQTGKDFSDAPETAILHMPPDVDVEEQEERVFKPLTNYALAEIATTVVERIVDTETGKDLPGATGTLENIREYADAMFDDDQDQKTAFEGIIAAFVVKLHATAKQNDAASLDMPPNKRSRLRTALNDLTRVNRGDQFICFLSGAGGTGKSHVIKAVVKYAKNLCDNLNVEYTKRTITVTALTGSAAVSIRGETTDKAACLRKLKIVEADEEAWENALMIIVDEISFCGKAKLHKLNACLNILKQKVNAKFGGIAVVFAGDFSQLTPVGRPPPKPLYMEEELAIWEMSVHTFYELRTNHRFKDDPNWGNLLGNYRDIGPTVQEVGAINQRVVGSENGPTIQDIPRDVAYAVADNVDKTAINDGVFAQHLRDTHSKNPSISPPKHTICIKAANLEWVKRSNGNNNEYVPFHIRMADLFYATVGEGHVRDSSGTKTYDPMLKLYFGCPVMINENISVENCLANGTMCKFVGANLKTGVTYEELEIIRIDGYYVWCASASQVDSLRLQILDGLEQADQVMYGEVEANSHVCTASVPIALGGHVNKQTHREKRKFRLFQFPVNIANARTIHKLQGRSLGSILVSVWDYTGNWVYVALSRVRTISGLFLRKPLIHHKCKNMSAEARAFLEKLRKKAPPARVDED